MGLSAQTLVLGIESSCDETAAAVVAGDRRILSHRILSQIEEHAPYGGVVPEIAARAHVEHLDGLVAAAMDEAGIAFPELAAVAATAGPGLIGGVLVGLTTAKAIAAAHALPLVAVNHLEGHALSVRLVGEVSFPYLLLLVSGGHCQLLAVLGPGQYRRYGTTIDDAVGEAFDKSAKIMGLGYPGGPALEARARSGDAGRFDLPRPMLGRDGCDFSFSGLKTAVRRAWESLEAPTDGHAADLAAAFQAAVADVLDDRTAHAMARFRDEIAGGAKDLRLIVAGGVAANAFLRGRLEKLARAEGFTMTAPPPELCTDNAAMIAWAGIERLELGLVDDLGFAARARWPLDEQAPPSLSVKA